MADEGAKETSQVVRSALIHYRKSNFCRVVHASGVWGGSTPQGKIRMAFYSEKVAVPQSAIIGLDKEGVARTTKETPTPQEFEREVEVEVMLDPEAALSLRNWLNRHMQGLIAESQDSEGV